MALVQIIKEVVSIDGRYLAMIIEPTREHGARGAEIKSATMKNSRKGQNDTDCVM